MLTREYILEQIEASPEKIFVHESGVEFQKAFLNNDNDKKSIKGSIFNHTFYSWDHNPITEWNGDFHSNRIEDFVKAWQALSELVGGPNLPGAVIKLKEEVIKEVAPFEMVREVERLKGAVQVYEKMTEARQFTFSR